MSPAIEITERGIEVDPLGEIGIHPAAELFPLLDGAAFDALVADIREHGQREAIAFTPDGLLLDGRNRWRACRKAGITPVTRTENGDPWAFAISANLHRRHLSDAQRAMVAAKIAVRGAGQPRKTSDDAILVPSAEVAAAMFNVGRSQIDRARVIRREGTAALLGLAEDGGIPVATGARVAEHLSPEEQDDYVRRVRNGADPVKLASALEVPVRIKNPERERDLSRSPKRHRHIGAAALENLRAQMEALDIVLNGTEGIDPSINAEEAAQWVRSLIRGRGHISRVINLLKEHGKATS